VRWRCADCGHTYDEAPERCHCGSVDVETDDGDPESRYSLPAVRRRLLEPREADRSLVGDDPLVVLAFRVFLLVSLVVLLGLVVASLL